MKKHTLTTLAFAALAAFGAVSLATAAEGDIYSIDPLVEILPGEYFEPGQTLRFHVRLLASNFTDLEHARPWERVHMVAGVPDLIPHSASELLDDLQTPPAIGIIVSGKLRPATIVDYKYGKGLSETTKDAVPYTDLICEYKVRPGDIALPVQLALAGSTPDKPIAWTDKAENPTYYFYNSDKWQIMDMTTKQVCRLYYCSDEKRGQASSVWDVPTRSDLGAANVDFSLTRIGFNVRGVDFDSQKDTDDYWRIVKEGTTDTTYRPTIETSGMPDESVTLYVWSRDSSVVEMYGDVTTMDIPLDASGAKTTKKVAVIKVTTGKTTYPIEIHGEKQGEWTELVLSTTPGHVYNQTGDIIVNYLTARVYCDKPPSPNIQLSFDPAYPTSAKTKTVETSMKTTENLADDAVPVYLTLSKAYETDLAVKIAVTNVGNVACDPITNRNVAVSQYGDSFSADDIAYTNLLIKAGDTEAVFYVYPLGGDAYTRAQGISFTPVTPGVTYYEIGNRAVLKIGSVHKPVVSSSLEGTDDAQDATGFQVPVMVQDCYRDLMNPAGFKVEVDFSDGSKMSPTNIVFSEGMETPVELKGYGVNARYANIKVTEPDGTAYGTVKINFTVKPQKTITASLYDSTEESSRHAGTVFNEGDKPIVRFTLSEKLAGGADRWAFLVPQNEASSNLVECTAFESGVLIPGGLTNSTLNTLFALRLKDGCGVSDGSLGALSYRIALRTADKLTEGEADTSYTDIAGLQFTVANVFPEQTKITVNNSPNGVEAGKVYSVPVPCDVAVPFGCRATEVSSLDLDAGIRSLWCFSEGRSSSTWKYEIVTSRVDRLTCEHRFTYPGVTQEVQVVTLDKDMFFTLTNKTEGVYVTQKQLAELWGGASEMVKPFSFYVAVSTKPAVSVETYGFARTDAGEAMDESGVGEPGVKAKIRIALSEAMDSARRVRVIAKPAADDNWGTLEFDTTTLPVSADPTEGVYTELEIPADALEPKSSSSYVAGQGLKFKYATLNGTAGSESAGWEIKAQVYKENDDGEWVVDSYFAQSEGTMISVVNLPPTVTPRQPGEGEPVTTNKNQTLKKAFDITWTPGDVAADVKAVWPGGEVGLKCEWYVNDEFQAGKTTYVTYKPGTTKIEQQTTEITLNDEGLSVVKLVITDLDGEDYHGITERTWLYYISPTKRLAVTPVGPAGNMRASRYKGKPGLGLGRVYADGGSCVVSGFSQTWSYNVTTKEATAYAFGYASDDAAYNDDGTLGAGNGKYDLAIDQDGENYPEGGTYYNYPGVYDNYFYRWAYIVLNEAGGAPTVEYGSLGPTTKPEDMTQEPVQLDEYEPEKESYATRRLEAIFSREWLPSDNAGDINGDGVPDLYLMRYVDLGICDGDGNVEGDDLVDIGRLNDDGDYLPNTMTAKYANFIPGLSNTWVTAGRAFTTKMEIRGADDNLNDAAKWAQVPGIKSDVRYTDLTMDEKSTLSYLEYVAFTNYCDRTGLDATVKANWEKWSPERPTDPTVADTDGDGMPDGYEYYLWYKAHVGELVVTKQEKQEKDRKVTVSVTNLVRYTGRKYNIVDPVHPIEITADEIEKIYDPITPNDQLAEIDTDLDGLPDLIEFEIGTNPFDYDTDHDGLPDGWEVAFSKTDPLNANNDADRNDDGDTMAYVSMPFWRYSVEGSNKVDDVWMTVTNYVYSYGRIATEGVDAEVPHSIFTAFSYKPGELDENGKQKPDALALGAMLVNRDAENNLAQIAALDIIPNSGEKVHLAVIHDQLLKYNLKPFDPRTGWGNGPDTKAYQNYDEFMLLSFYLNTDEATLDNRSLNIASDPHFGGEKLIDMWARTTTNPHNADTNGDGVPDGWQLYVSWDHSVCGKDDPIIKQEQKILKQIGPFGSGAPMFDIGSGDKIIDSDKDGLNLQQEFCGTESCAFYPKCETIKNVQPEWRNKKWPTDPQNPDTDGDGLTDGEERVWLYGTSGMDGGGLNPLSWDTDLDGLPDPWELEFCGTYSEGGSQNETSQVTTTNAVATADGGTSNVVSTATNVVVVAGKFNNDGMNPTASDASADYDGDGLLNWQEYMVGTMRCWRYDDSVTPWAPSDGFGNGWGEAYKPLLVGEMEELFNGFSYVDLFRYFEGRWTVSKDADMIEAPESDYVYNRGFRMGHIDPGAYFSCCKNPWDPAFGRLYYFKDGVDHDLKDDWFQPWKEMKDYTTFNRWQAKTSLHVSPDAFLVAVQNAPIYPKKYISCNPKESDTDFDGMDDYYELFHGLNPLLGAPGVATEKVPCDIIYMAYGGGDMLNATANYYLYWDNELGYWAMNLPMRNDGREGGQDLRLKDVAGGVSMDPTKYLDFYQFPWLAGLPTADPDGDNIRNQQESILLKAQAAPTYQHTDPTPLWMTDTSFNYSLTKRFYQAVSSGDIPPLSYHPAGAADWDPEVYGKDAKDETPTKVGWFVHDKKLYMIDDIPWLKYIPALQAIRVDYNINQFNAPANIYSYEENEGYDSDHDYLSDFEESQGRTKPVSDPQQHDDPIRHQAMYFDGVDARLQAPLEVDFPLPSLEASSESRQDFLYFTVEAWAKVDQSNIDDGALHTVIERAVLTGESGPADEKFLRKNFLIGVKGGRWYGKFDSTGTDAGKAVEILDGPAATTNWTHLAFTYGPANGDEQDDVQPMALRLYVHDTAGDLVRMSELGNLRLQPEHGESAIQIDPKTKVGMATTTPWVGKDGITIVVGASVATATGINMQDIMSGPDAYENYFKGYIDEVRVWDGARKMSEIADDVMTRYTSALAQENRARVFAAWKDGGLRTPLSPTALPAELRYHWAFDHLPSAVDTTNLLKVPAGFSTSESVLDSKALWVRPLGYVCPWWSAVATVSSVFADHAWVPWINNTVSHLPCLDGSTLDSIYWSEMFAGDQSVTNFATASFAFPRTAEVWSFLTMSTPAPTWWNRIAEDKDTKAMCRFNLRNRVTVGADLLPLGGAYPKRISSLEGGMWDDPSASDAWAETGTDTDDNGLPDWWEKYAMKNYSPVLGRGEPFGILTTVSYHGTTISAKEAYLSDLAAGMLTDGKIHPEYADNRDSDKDGMPDWWEDLYGIQTNSPDDRDADPDKDGLSNYQEYLLSVVYPREHEAEFAKYGIRAPHLNPMLARSSMAEGVNQLVTDYYLRYSDTIADEIKNGEGWSNFYLNEYFGEIATDHDFMEDWWEKATGSSYANPKKYDPLADKDEDGWSNWAECRAALWGGYFSAELVDKWTGTDSGQYVKCYPEPILGVKVTYHGVQNISGQQLVIKATTGQTPRTDATFVIPATADAQTRYIGGFNADRELRGHLTPGLINPNSIVFEAARTSSDKTYYWNWAWYEENNVTHPEVSSGSFEDYRHYYALYPKIELEGGDLTWEAFGQIIPNGDLGTAKVIVEGGIEMGSVNCTTGEYTLDMTKMPLKGEASEYVYRVTYTSRVGHEWPQTVYVSDTKELASGTGTGGVGNGRLREGRNNIEAFIDLTPNGVYDEGEPYGSVRNVQVGWHKVPVVTIELKDESPIMNRVDVGGGSAAGGDLASALAAALGLGGGATGGNGLTTKVRIVREMINEATAVKTLATKTVVLDDRPYLTELDVCTSAKPDLDWGTLVKDAERVGVPVIESATYAVYQVDEATSSNATQLASFVKRFPETRPLATAVAPKDRAPVYTASPTFSFSVSDTKATAYRLQVRKVGDSRAIYDSGVALLPGRTGSTVGASVCEVTPAIYAGAPVYTGTTTNRLVFADGTNYEWRVALFDAKYNATTDDSDYSPEWSTWSVFEMDVCNQHRYPEIDTGCGSVSLAVRYYGPCAMNPTNIIVEAYENADFCGQALAQIRLSDLEFLGRQDDIKTANAVLSGIPAATFFVRAFYDQNDNGLRDSWESWGYANEVGTDLKAIYNPHPIAGDVKSVVTIYMEDADVNQNEYPDSLEPEKFPEEASVEASEAVDWWDWAEAAPEDVTDGSVMAYYQTKLYQVTLWDGVDATRFYTYLVEDDTYVPGSGQSATGLVLATCYDYGDRLVGYGVPASTNDYQDLFVYGTPKEVDVVYVHAQVREKFGFSSNTAIPGGTENTKAFTAEDKYLVLRYLEQTGRIPAELIAIARNANKSSFESYVYSSGNEKIYAKYTLKPSLVDSDYDGIADGWELYVDYDPLNAADRTTDDDNDGLQLWQEYDENVKAATVRPTDPRDIDTDGDGVLDYYAYQYGLKGGDAGKDFDGDGLSNYAEYLITEVFKYAKCDPRTYATDDGVCDYYKKVGDLYLGEIFTDHDMMDDVWEEQYGAGSVNRGVFDSFADPDGDGWSNYAEFRAGTDPTTTVALSIDGYVCPEYPVPAIAANIIYNGSVGISGPLVLKAWNEAMDYDMVKVPDAVWTLGTAESATDTDKGGDNATSGNTQGSDLQQHEKFLGRKPTGERTFYLTGGNISEGSVKLLFLDKGYGLVTYDALTDSFHAVGAGEPDEAMWYYAIIDRDGELVRVGSSVYKALGYEDAVVGTVDYKTGRITIDFDHEELSGTIAADPSEGQSGSSGDNKDAKNDTAEAGVYHWLDLDESYMRIEWKTSQAATSTTGIHYFSDPDPASEMTRSLGHLREGLNTFVCFADNDSDGAYTPGEPYGVVRGVNVGWSDAALDIELTDMHPVFARLKFEDGNSDRTTLLGSDGGNMVTNTSSTGEAEAEGSGDTEVLALSGGTHNHVRIVPYLMSSTRIDGSRTEREYVECLNWLPTRVVAEFDVDASTHPCITEADFIRDGKFDIDWDGFATTDFALNNRVVADVGDITAVKYQIVMGVDGPAGVSYVGDTTTVVRAYSTLIERRFEPQNARTTPTELKLAQGAILYGGHPTFTWRLDEPTTVENFAASSALFGCSYTAFQIQVADKNDTIVYDSGVQRAPAKDATGRFVWTAPLVTGQQTDLAKIFEQAGDWKWHVAMYNAKFKPKARANGWSDYATFSTAVGQQQEADDHGYGSIKAAVKYAGPVAVLAKCEDATAKGKVRVQAFTTPDCSGVPEAEAILTDKASLTNALDVTANVTLAGLRNGGTYYIRAYVDSDGDFAKSDWESWGVSKKSVAVVPNKLPETVGVWIEDADTDGDWMPDAWEYVTDGYTVGVSDASVDPDGKIVYSVTYNDIADGTANISKTLSGSSLTFFENINAASLLLGFSSGAKTETIAAIREAVEKKIQPETVKVTSLVVDAANKQVILTVAADVADSIAGQLLSPVYTIPTTAKVYVDIYKKASLVDLNWVYVNTYEQEVSTKLDKTIKVPVSEDFTSGFYKVEVRQ